jgi:hypothetical protein
MEMFDEFQEDTVRKSTHHKRMTPNVLLRFWDVNTLENYHMAKMKLILQKISLSVMIS